MRKKFSYGIVLGLVLVLFLQSCTGGGQTNFVSDDDFRKGTSSVSVNFVKDLPPQELLEDSVFQVGVEVQNNGAYNITNGFLNINYDQAYVDLFTTPNKNLDLDGRNRFLKEGETDSFFFEGKTRVLETESTRRTVPLIATMCYQYQTILDEVLCLDSDFISNRDTGVEVCKAENKKYGGQGAPVVIREVNYNVIPTETNQAKTTFDILIQHKSASQSLVIDSDNYRSACSSNIGDSNLNVVKFQVSLSDQVLDCGDNFVTLRNDEARIRCESQPIPEIFLPFEAPLYIELDYGYMASVSTSFDILRP